MAYLSITKNIMKNLSYIFNGVLAIAVAVLFYLHFKQVNGSTTEVTVNTGSADTSAAGMIAYVNTDSLESQYDLFKTMKKDLEAEGRKMETGMNAKKAAFQKAVGEYQQKAQMMTTQDRAATEQKLAIQQQELEQYAQELGLKAQDKQMAINKKLFETVESELKPYCDKKGIKLVLSYVKGSNILYGSNSIDITSDVIKMLNEKK